MRILKKIVTLFLVVVLMTIALQTGASAASSPNGLIEIENTATSFALSIPDLLDDIGTDPTISDRDNIIKIIQLLFEAKKDQMEHSNYAAFDFIPFWNTNPTDIDALNHFSRSVEAQKKTLLAYNQYASDAALELDFRSINITQDTAVVQVYEWLEYNCRSLDDNALCWPSTLGIKTGTGIEYGISMKKTEKQWLIIDIDFFDESTETLKSSNICVDQFVQERKAASMIPSQAKILFDSTDEGVHNKEVSTYLNNPILPYGAVMPPGLPVLTPVDTARFVSYANQYAGSNRNSLFVDYTSMGGDCQNYASQCLWYSMGGVNTRAAINGKYEPMIKASLTSSVVNRWYHGAANDYSASWTGVGNFAQAVSAGGAATVGLNGTIYSGVANAQVGDIIQIRESGDNVYYHSYVVVAVTGTKGSRTTSNITVCSHTTDRTATVLSRLFASDSLMRTIHVNGVITLSE